MKELKNYKVIKEQEKRKTGGFETSKRPAGFFVNEEDAQKFRDYLIDNGGDEIVDAEVKTNKTVAYESFEEAVQNELGVDTDGN